ncbi:MAG: transposase [Cyanobacteria bacterium P01_D01_bin.50]
MPRNSRNFIPGYAYHITTRCNNREFKLQRRECREVFLYCLKKALDKYKFKLYGLCIMSNHVHYLLEPKQPEDLSKIMHFLNWYTAMCFNRMLNRTGHFWEKRYFADGFPSSDKQRALNTLRYIHGNPKAAKMRSTFFYEFSNYGSYEKLTNDGLTQWHPAFMQLGRNLDECANKYRGFCNRYKPKSKPARKCHWGNKLLAGVKSRSSKKSNSNNVATSSSSSSWAGCQVSETLEVSVVARPFQEANQAPWRVQQQI